SALLKAREVSRSPFATPIKSNEPAHWVRPDLIAQVRFTEWTNDGKLRHPVYLGLRDDKRASDVQREDPVRPNPRTPAKKPSKSSGPRAASRRASTQETLSTAPVIEQLRALEDAR